MVSIISKAALALVLLVMATVYQDHLDQDPGYQDRLELLFTNKNPLDSTKSETEFAQRTKRTAVVWTTIGVTTVCEAARLLYLVETAGLDVWVLYAHHVLESKNKTEDISRSNELMTNITGLHRWPQRESRFERFDGFSGSGKSSFLSFLAEHPQYDYAWHVENDMFFTGPWKDFFLLQEHRDATEDFLTTFAKGAGKEWNWIARRDACRVFQQQCLEVVGMQMGWMISRVSSRLARSLMNDLVNGQILGHHEAVLGPYFKLHKYNFTHGLVDPSTIGNISFGHLPSQRKKLKEMDVAYFGSQRGKLLHPVKCEAYFDANNIHNHHPEHKTMQSDLDKWAIPLE